ncbi:DUF4138 domain-containing protein [Chitinophaga defluvii]|uniref:DUF4138 domain-containing protein n=1 Tax=Chitinophaga defluvii TaxID=3163343 RepID=A0ABV2T8R6_9BACT
MCVRKSVTMVSITSLLLLVGHHYVSAQPVVPIIQTIEAPVAKRIASFPLSITTEQTSVLIFPSNIKSVDRGSAALLCKTVKEAPNVLKIKAANDSLVATNLNVFVADGTLFPFSVRYQQIPDLLTLDFTDPKQSDDWHPVNVSKYGMNEVEVQQFSDIVAGLPPFQRTPHSNRIGSMRAQVSGKYYQQGILFFQFTVENQSQLPYELDFARCYIRDNRSSLRSSDLEKEIKPLYVHQVEGNTISPQSQAQIVFAFDKFTIANNKHFSVEFFERGGDRNMRIKIKGKQILRVRPLLPYLSDEYSNQSFNF